MRYTDDPTPQPRKIVAYLRTASSGQSDRHTLEHQRDICEAQASNLGVKIELFYVDAGVSGMTPSRPSLDALFDDLALGQTDYVIAADRTRLARDPALALSLERQIAHTGALLITNDSSN
jgi:DNA invertase Pin-like site-specific DNA recombinase